VFAGPQWHEEWAVPGLIVYNSVRSSAYNELHCYTDTLSFRNVSMRRHLVKFAATVAADLPDDRYNDWWPATPGNQRRPTLGRHVLVHDLWSDCRHAADIDRRTIALCDVCRSIPR